MNRTKLPPPASATGTTSHLAYRTENAIYLYVHQTQAYLWNDSLDAGWESLKAHLPADRLRDLR